MDSKKALRHIELRKKMKAEILEYKKMGITHVRISTAGDDDVCETCQKYEGQTFLINKAPLIPLCENCRCAYEYLFPDEV